MTTIFFIGAIDRVFVCASQRASAYLWSRDNDGLVGSNNLGMPGHLRGGENALELLRVLLGLVGLEYGNEMLVLRLLCVRSGLMSHPLLQVEEMLLVLLVHRLLLHRHNKWVRARKR